MTFFWKNTSSDYKDNHIRNCSPKKYLSNKVSYASNRHNMTKLRPREVGYPTNPNKAHKLLVLHLLRLGF